MIALPPSKQQSARMCRYYFNVKKGCCGAGRLRNRAAWTDQFRAIISRAAGQSSFPGTTSAALSKEPAAPLVPSYARIAVAEVLMNTRYFALIFGIVFAAVGVAGFIPGLLTPPGAEEPALTVEAARGRLLGFFPVNVLHDAVHLAFGIWGIVAYRSLGAARLYAQAIAVIYAVLVVMGLIPVLNTTFG